MNAAAMLMARFILRDLARNKVRTFLTIAGIALGVAVMLAIHLANQAALSQFSQSIDLVAGRSNLAIRSLTGNELDESVLDRLDWLHDKHVKFTPLIDQFAVVVGDDGTELVQILGVDMFSDRAFRPLRSQTESKEASDSGDAVNNAPFQFLQKDSAMIGRQLADRFHLQPGDTLKIQVNEHLVDLKVGSILDPDGVGKAFGGNVVLMDIGPAQQLFDMRGTISRVDMIVPEGTNKQELSANLQAVLPSGTTVDAPERRTKQVEKMLSSFQYNLVALSLIALLVGMFVIYNTMSISVIRRRFELGTLRALGVGRATILFLFSAEALILGAVGSLCGAGMGLSFAHLALAAVSRTVKALYADQAPASIAFQAEPIIIAVLAGIAMTLLAAAAPALEAVNVEPAEATRRASFERKVQHMSVRLALAGAALAGFAFWASRQPAINGFPVWGFGAAAAAVFAVALVTPIFLNKFLPSVKGLFARILGTEAGLAVSGLYGALGRTSVAVASLMVGISMMVSLAVMIGSFRDTVIAWVQQTLRADMWVEPAGRKVSSRIGRMSPELVKKLRAVQGIEALEAFIDYPFEYEGSPSNIGAGEIPVVANYGNLPFVDGEKSGDVLRRIEGKSAVVISETFAQKHNKTKGQQMVLPALDGPLPVKIEGIYYDYSSDLGFVIMDRNVFRQHFRDDGSTTLAIYLKPGQDSEAVRQALLKAGGSNAQLVIRSNKEIKKEVLRVFDNTFAITYALHAISIAVAILGVMNTLFALTMESKRDMGILKYLGASAGQIRKLILVQAGILGALGSVGGLITGFALSWLLIHVINKQSFGWTIQFAVPYEFLLQSFALIMFCSLASGIIPAGIAAKTLAPEALRTE